MVVLVPVVYIRVGEHRSARRGPASAVDVGVVCVWCVRVFLSFLCFLRMVAHHT